jgi:hypothetical protein
MRRCRAGADAEAPERDQHGGAGGAVEEAHEGGRLDRESTAELLLQGRAPGLEQRRGDRDQGPQVLSHALERFPHGWKPF